MRILPPKLPFVNSYWFVRAEPPRLGPLGGVGAILGIVGCLRESELEIGKGFTVASWIYPAAE